MGNDRSPENNNSTCKNVVLQNQVYNDHLGSSNDPCYIQNCVIWAVSKKMKFFLKTDLEMT